MVCRNPLLAGERARKRQDLLAATEADLTRVAKAVSRKRQPLRGAGRIGLAAGAVLHRYKACPRALDPGVAKHFTLTITDDHFAFARDTAEIEAESRLDGVYVIRTNLTADDLAAPEVVRSYKDLARAERAFRSLKTVDLEFIRSTTACPIASAAMSCFACWLTTSNGICARHSLPCCSTITNATKLPPPASPSSRQRSAQRRRAARRPASARTTACQCSAFNRCLPNWPRSPATPGPRKPPAGHVPALPQPTPPQTPRLRTTRHLASIVGSKPRCKTGHCPAGSSIYALPRGNFGLKTLTHRPGNRTHMARFAPSGRQSHPALLYLQAATRGSGRICVVDTQLRSKKLRMTRPAQGESYANSRVCYVHTRPRLQDSRALAQAGRTVVQCRHTDGTFLGPLYGSLCRPPIQGCFGPHVRSPAARAVWIKRSFQHQTSF